MTRSAVVTVAALLFIAPPAPAADPPRVVRENIEWLDVWVPGNGVKDQPRVLQIGDSIARGYYKPSRTRSRARRSCAGSRRARVWAIPACSTR